MNDEFTSKPDLILGKYRHIKGDLYEVIDLASHSETLEWYVVYKPLYDHPGKPDLWVRPYEMFSDLVIREGVEMPRFKKVDEDETS